MSRVQQALEQMAFSRRYSLRLIEATNPADWFRQPAEGVTHLAWQVGHLATAQYRLCLDRVRGRRPGDERVIPEDFVLLYGKDSTANPDPAQNPKPAEIRDVLDRVYQQVMAELPTYGDEDLDVPNVKPHPYFATKLGGLEWCARHELVHAGQIALLRRLLGSKPLW
jgi:hypothetical protein